MKKLMNWISRIVSKRSEEKNELLQTYFTSLFSLVLCVIMFFGTTYAWFTSEVTNTANEIYIGVLDVELKKQDKTDSTKWKSLSEVDAQGVNTTKLFDGSIRWEPGYTSLETIQVVNEGDLAFKYVLQFTDGKAEKKDDQSQTGFTDVNVKPLADIAKCFDVWVYNHAQDTPYAVPTSYAVITAENSGWNYAGTLDQILAGQPALQGAVNEEEIAKQENGESDAGVHTYTIAMHMKEAADDSVMGHKISLNVKLIAYQAASEKDDFGNSGFDEVTLVSDLDEFKAAMANPSVSNMLLTADIAMDEVMTVEKDVDIDLNGHTLSTVGFELKTTASSIFNGTITSAADTNMIPHLSVTSGTLTMENITVQIDDALNYAAQGNRSYYEYTGIGVDGATLILKDSHVYVKGERSCTWSYVYGISLNNGAVLHAEGGSITAISENGTETNSEAAVTGYGNCEATLHGVAVDSEKYGSAMNGTLIVNTTDTTVTQDDFDIYDGVVTLNYIE